MHLSLPQRRLIEFLIAESTSISAGLEQRWGKAAPDAQRYAADHGRLLLLRDWTVDLVMAPDGSMSWFDHETTEAPPDPTPWEEHTALYRGLFHYPELVAILPPPPVGAKTCPECNGAGLSTFVFENPQLRSVLCSCAGAGWIADIPGRPKDHTGAA